MNKKLVPYFDVETGLPTMISEQAYNAIQSNIKKMHEYINNGSNKVKVIIASTLNDGNDSDDFKNIWSDNT